MKQFASMVGGLTAGLLCFFSLQTQAISLGPAIQMGVLVSATEAKTDKVLRAEALELSAGMQVDEWEAVYVPLRNLAKVAANEKRFKDSADLWVRAAYQHRVPAFRAAALRNAGFYSSRIGDCEVARSRWKRALNVLKNANPAKFPGHKDSRHKTLADIYWGLDDSACKKR